MESNQTLRKLNIKSKKQTSFFWLVSIFSIIFLSTACQEEFDAVELESKKVTITIGQEFYDDLASKLSNGSAVESDPFILRKAFIDGNELHINLSYSGGCEEHNFELLWPEHTPQIYPYQLVVYLIHDANGDLCEAAIDETLVIDLMGKDLNYDIATISQLEIIVVNGFDVSDQVSTKD